MSEEVPETIDPAESTEPVEPVEQGVQGRTQRDMQSVTRHVEERAALDIRNLERAIDRLVKIREMDRKVEKPPFVPTNKLSPEDVKYFMERTGEDKASSEKILDSADGDVQTAFAVWLQTNPCVNNVKL
jgi:NACalpha-BTF3-like transcription factor